MITERRKLTPQEFLPLLIGSIPFLLAAIDAFQQGDSLMAVVNGTMVTVNLIALRFMSSHSLQTNVILFILNGITGLFVGYSYYLAGKKGLPYAWLVVAFVYWGAAIVFYRRQKKKMTGQHVENISSRQ